MPGDLRCDVFGRALSHVNLNHTLKLAHPCELTACVIAGTPLHTADVTGKEVVEAERLAGGAARSGGMRRTDLLLHARGKHRVHTGVDLRVQTLALGDEPDQQGGMASRPGP